MYGFNEGCKKREIKWKLFFAWVWETKLKLHYFHSYHSVYYELTIYNMLLYIGVWIWKLYSKGFQIWIARYKLG